MGLNIEWNRPAFSAGRRVLANLPDGQVARCENRRYDAHGDVTQNAPHPMVSPCFGVLHRISSFLPFGWIGGRQKPRGNGAFSFAPAVILSANILKKTALALLAIATLTVGSLSPARAAGIPVFDKNDPLSPSNGRISIMVLNKRTGEAILAEDGYATVVIGSPDELRLPGDTEPAGI
ncbi:MAG: hypothetical protein LBI59_12450 [Candidatus Accumulibacter sp.]|jgi:hypothetical protein|nr:hypothetical protein [Accumulibacter sp.]